MKHEQAAARPMHPLEFNDTERAWFLNAHSDYRMAYRRATEAVTGSLPTWAARRGAGRPQAVPAEHHGEIRRLLALGVPVSKVAVQFSTSRATITRIRDAAEGAADE